MSVPDRSILQLLSRTSQRLAESLDYEKTLLTVAEMALPFLGSWCIVDIIEPGNRMRRVGIVHPDTVKQAHARRLEDSWHPIDTDLLGLPQAVRSRRSEVIPRVPDSMLVELAHSEENLADLRALGIGSVIVVPLIARDNVLGAITFVSADIGHQYTKADVELAEDLASRCAIALDNARLFKDAETAREQVEEARSRAVQVNEKLVIATVRQQALADEAREANQAKSQFLATLSHEIRTPINAIVGYTDLLGMEIAGPMTPEQREFLDRIQTSSLHLIGLVDDILDLAKVESGRMHLEQEILPASIAIAAAVALIEPQARVAGLTVETTCADDATMYVGDGDRVRQILVILLSNALKFTERGGRVSLSCGTADVIDADSTLAGSGPWSFLRVEDTGIGISEAEARTVFHPFVQADAGNTRKRGGAGLGLAIGLELAHRMGGDLTLRSKLGGGSTFTLWLPPAPAGEG